MNEKAEIRILNANDHDLMDAQTTLNLIPKLVEQNSQSKSYSFTPNEVETLIRNWRC